MKKTYIKPIMTVEGVNMNCLLQTHSLTNGGKASESGITTAGSRRLRVEDDDEFDEISLDEFFRSWE